MATAVTGPRWLAVLDSEDKIARLGQDPEKLLPTPDERMIEVSILPTCQLMRLVAEHTMMAMVLESLGHNETIEMMKNGFVGSEDN